MTMKYLRWIYNYDTHCRNFINRLKLWRKSKSEFKTPDPTAIKAVREYMDLVKKRKAIVMEIKALNDQLESLDPWKNIR